MPIVDNHNPSATYSQATWLQALRFRLNPAPDGEFRFSHVHLYGAWTLTRRESFLQDLMNGRSIREVVYDLTPSDGGAEYGQLDSKTAAEMRAYFSGLANALHLPPHIGSLAHQDHPQASVELHHGHAESMH